MADREAQGWKGWVPDVCKSTHLDEEAPVDAPHLLKPGLAILAQRE